MNSPNPKVIRIAYSSGRSTVPAWTGRSRTAATATPSTSAARPTTGRAAYGLHGESRRRRKAVTPPNITNWPCVKLTIRCTE
jgi:hypothetical protein